MRLEESETRIEVIRKIAENYAPNYDVDAILQELSKES